MEVASGRATLCCEEPHPAQPAPLIPHPSSVLYLLPPFPSSAPHTPPTLPLWHQLLPIPALDQHLCLSPDCPCLVPTTSPHWQAAGALCGLGELVWEVTRWGGDTLPVMDTPSSGGILLHPLRRCQGHREGIQGTRMDRISLAVPRAGLRSGGGYSRHPRQQPSLTRQLRTNISRHRALQMGWRDCFSLSPASLPVPPQGI